MAIEMFLNSCIKSFFFNLGFICYENLLIWNILGMVGTINELKNVFNVLGPHKKSFVLKNF